MSNHPSKQVCHITLLLPHDGHLPTRGSTEIIEITIRFCITIGECRGVGGIFFDDLNQPSQEAAFQFVQAGANSVLPGYVPIVEKHKDDPYTDEQQQWQLLRRGR